VLLKAMLAAREGRRPGAPLTPRAERLLKRLPALLLLLLMLLRCAAAAAAAAAATSQL